ncbi:MAG: hypothetical protein E7393_02815 [Ruminococcaceae bacterium]|nr:hypothetical protein [Oscillospiraceae bacterium]
MKPSISCEQIETRLLLPFLNELLLAGQNVRMTVTGVSMYPMLRNRQDSVCLTAQKKPNKYDVVLFVRDSGEAVLHRIIACHKDGFILLGDNQLTPEGPIVSSQIQAVVDGFYRGDTYIPDGTLWYHVYRVIWGRFWRARRLLRPFVIGFGRLLKHLKRME